MRIFKNKKVNDIFWLVTDILVFLWFGFIAILNMNTSGPGAIMNAFFSGAFLMLALWRVADIKEWINT